MTDDSKQAETQTPATNDQTPPAANAASVVTPPAPPASVTPESNKDNVSDLSADDSETSADTNADAAKADLNAKGLDESGITVTEIRDGIVSFESAEYSVLLESVTSAPVLRIRKVGTVGEELSVAASGLKGLLNILSKANSRAKSDKLV